MEQMKLLVLVNGAPYGTATPAEAYRTISGLGGMGIDTTCVLVEDGVFVALKNQNPSSISMQDISRAYTNLKEFDVKVYISKEALIERNIKETELIENNGVISNAELKELINGTHCIISFVSGG